MVENPQFDNILRRLNVDDDILIAVNGKVVERNVVDELIEKMKSVNFSLLSDFFDFEEGIKDLKDKINHLIINILPSLYDGGNLDFHEWIIITFLDALNSDDEFYIFIQSNGHYTHYINTENLMKKNGFKELNDVSGNCIKNALVRAVDSLEIKTSSDYETYFKFKLTFIENKI